MGGSAELGRRVMGGVGATGTREREEDFVRFMALFHYERMAQLARAMDERSREKNFLASGKKFVDGC